MKRHIRVETCPVCGHKANTSRWWTKAKNGKIYHYYRYYHSDNNIHLVRTDSTYSVPRDVGDRRDDLFARLEDFIYRRMGSRKYTFTSLKREFDRFYGQVVYNNSFTRGINRAVSSGLVKKKLIGKRPVYEKEPAARLDVELKFDKFAIHYDVAKNFVKVSTFLLVTNVGRLPADSIPFYIPHGISDSVDELHLKIITEDGEVPSSEVVVVIANALETVLSVSLKRQLILGEQEFVSILYEIPSIKDVLKLVTKTNIDILRVGISLRNNCEAETIRTLVDGAKEARSLFQHKRNYGNDNFSFYSEFEDVKRGECVSISLKKCNYTFI